MIKCIRHATHGNRTTPRYRDNVTRREQVAIKRPSAIQRIIPVRGQEDLAYIRQGSEFAQISE